MAKKTKEEALNLDAILFKCRDILRQAKNSGSFFEKRDMMLTLVFLRFIGEKYEDGLLKLRQTLQEQGLDPDDPNIQMAFFEDATFADGTFPLAPEARWSTIIDTPAPQLNVALDTALRSIGETNPTLKGCFVEGTFTQRNLGANDIKKIVDEINKISHKTFGEEKDLIGRVYEYFLKEFAVNATKEEGEFYTPHDVVQLIATVIEPFDGTLYDPCCGSGGMFIQSTDLVKAKQGDISRINVYGQEKEAATYRLAKMNLALRGISHNLGSESDSSFTNDLHKGLYFDYIMANPPFNLKGWYNENLEHDPRWNDYATPPESNANYAWILHMLSHLKPLSGVAGFLLANGALGDTDALEIRKKLIQNDKVEAIIILPRELFITTDISVTFWILNQNKQGGKYHGRELRNREHEILFMDLRTWTENPVKGEQKKKVLLSQEQIKRVADLYHLWQSVGTDGQNFAVPEFYRSVGIDEIEKKNWTLIPSKYIEFVDHDRFIDYSKEKTRIEQEMREIIRRKKESIEQLEKAFKGIGYGIE
jgi:type I restriction enzyme M protein